MIELAFRFVAGDLYPPATDVELARFRDSDPQVSLIIKTEPAWRVRQELYIRDALMEQSKSDSADGSNMTPLLNVLNGLAENNFGINGFTIRKLKESEVALLLRSFWLSIREELGLTQRNLFIAVISSSLVLGLLLLFIFIGTSALNIFSK